MSNGILCVPDRLASGEKRPGVVLCHGLTAVKELILLEIAQRFSALGYVALIFDYRFFGGSGGKPRRQVLPLCQVEDIRHAPAFLQLQPAVAEKRVGMCGIGDCGRWMRGSQSFWEWKGRLASTQALFAQTLQLYPQWSREITLGSAGALMAFRPESVVSHIAPRAVMWVHGEEDERFSPEESQSMYARAGSPKRLLLVPGLGYSDLLVGAGLEKVWPEVSGWYEEHL